MTHFRASRRVPDVTLMLRSGGGLKRGMVWVDKDVPGDDSETHVRLFATHRKIPLWPRTIASDSLGYTGNFHRNELPTARFGVHAFLKYYQHWFEGKSCTSLPLVSIPDARRDYCHFFCISIGCWVAIGSINPPVKNFISLFNLKFDWFPGNWYWRECRTSLSHNMVILFVKIFTTAMGCGVWRSPIMPG